ncbi:MAG: protein-L-isoaspartate(D-aspartate) O-methyltransferase [Peptococcaceae bacterium BICA1-8]|nr:MAG: protein-L-isoaspartate(D-aspartate) O-methyltransferase [Peptococcaceae bacterium BICA1-8]
MDNEFRGYAGEDKALPIGFEQTISQPSLVLEMTLHLDLNKESKVLEIGTGSGYQTALLAKFSHEVYSVERISELSQKAQERLSKLGYKNVSFRVGDGSEGWAQYAPYDRIIVTAGAGIMPKELIEQLALGGKMVIPVGKKEVQELVLISKDEQGQITKESLGKVRFVPLVGKYTY